MARESPDKRLMVGSIPPGSTNMGGGIAQGESSPLLTDRSRFEPWCPYQLTCRVQSATTAPEHRSASGSGALFCAVGELKNTPPCHGGIGRFDSGTARQFRLVETMAKCLL